MPILDPTALYRLRDSIYAADFLIAAVTEFDLFTWLSQRGWVKVADMAVELGLTARPLDVLLTYCAALGLVDRDIAGDRVHITELARQHLVAGSAYDLRAYYGSLAERPAVAELVHVLRTDEQAAWASSHGHDDWSGRLSDVDFARSITAAMDARSAFLGPALAHAISDIPVSALLDIGGSSGSYARAIIESRPNAKASVFERAPVDAAARTLLRESGWDKRISVVTGDMFADPLPSGHDAHLYSQVLHDWAAEQVEHLLASSYAALPAGGWLIDHDTHLNADKRGPLPVAEYSVLLMHSTRGKCWSTAELAEMAERVGFVDVSHRTTVCDRGVLLARKP
ncbi:methyltransferase [Skermania sp. ID1734]|uniref:methyltransferase n=1 Tax=Skermania sp. ID1734 TaxID=2597516 RepID=UPI00163D8688|nr:methyltransferase [Skermania sp. ID1734]